ncbi:MAG: rhodanese-like domain-containing protein [Burkholderiales bacterium]
MTNLSATELKTWLDDQSRPRPILLDVREPWEWDICRIEPSRHMPMRSVPIRLDELAKDAEIVVICHHGGRSLQVGHFLEHQGFGRVYNLAGGVHGWSQRVDPSVAVY